MRPTGLVAGGEVEVVEMEDTGERDLEEVEARRLRSVKEAKKKRN